MKAENFLFSSYPPGFEKENIKKGSTLFLSQNEPVRPYSIHTHFSLQIVILKTRENEKVEAIIAIEEEEARLGKWTEPTLAIREKKRKPRHLWWLKTG